MIKTKKDRMGELVDLGKFWTPLQADSGWKLVFLDLRLFAKGWILD